MLRFLSFGLAVGLCSYGAGPARGQAPATQTLPLGFEVREGNGSTSFPLFTTGTHRWHWVYDSAQFLAAGPIAITQIDLRPEGGLALWGPATYANFELRLGAAANDYRAGVYSATFDANWAPGTGSPHTFFSGSLAVPAGVGGSAPSPWSVQVSGAPFMYDPSAGRDFVIEVRTPGAGAGNPLLHSIDGQSGSSGTVGGNRYGNTSSAFATLATFASNEFAPIVRIHFQPATGLFAGFAAQPRSGPSPLAVSFTDTSFTSDPSGIQSWAWDFDEDRIVDSTSRFPSFTYSTCGSFDVSLTVTDTLHGPATMTRADYVQVDPQSLLQAGFNAAPLGALRLGFTDASIGNPLTWAWDLNGDGVVDSTAQSASFTYPAPGPYTARLTVTNACDTATFAQIVYAVANDECTDAIALPQGVNGPFDSRGATTSLTWPCSFAGADLWFVYDARCTSNVRIDTCTNPTLDTTLAVWSGGCTALTLLGCNDDVCGLQSQVDVNGVAAGQRLWISVGGFQGASGSFYLSLVETPIGNGSFATAFPGCGTLSLSANGIPNIGGSVRYDLSGVQGTPFLNLGMNAIGVPICAAGCSLGATLDATYAASGMSIPIPCDPTIRGGSVYTQGFDLGATGGCATGDPFPIVLSQTLVTTIG